MTEHTPTPWRVHGLYLEEIYATVDGKRQQVADIWGACTADQDVINAAFIVKACNAHDDLVKALRAISEFCSGDLTTLGSIARLASIQTEARAALASIKETV